MFTNLRTRFMMLAAISMAVSVFAATRVSAQYNGDTTAIDRSLDAVVTVFLASDGQAHAVGSGLIVRSDGYILTPYSLVRDAREVQIRLRNGETYDKAEVVSTDERRNIAIVRINAVGLHVVPNGTVEETQVGARIWVVTNPSGQTFTKSDLTLNSVQMADGIPGAGRGYRIMQFDAIGGANTAGGLVLDDHGRTLGIITTTPDIRSGNIAVPMSSFIGMVRSLQANTPMTTAANPVPAPVPANTPVPIPQKSVFVPERGVTPLSAKGPGSAVVKPHTAAEVLAVSKTIYVTSRTVSFKPDHLVNALNSRQEMTDWGLTFVEERDLADLILEIDHVLYTWKYTFKLYSERLGVVVASGSKIIWDGNLGAPYMAERVIDKIAVVRGRETKTPAAKPKGTADDK